MFSTKIQHILFNVFSSQNFFAVESKDCSGNSYLTLIDTFSPQLLLSEKKLPLPPAVFLKSVIDNKIYFAECRNPELPEVSLYHIFDFDGIFLKTVENEDFTKDNFIEKEIFEQSSNFFNETADLLSKNPAYIQSSIYYLENQQVAAVLFVENEQIILQLVGEKKRNELILKKNVRINMQNIHFRLYKKFIFVFLEELSEIFTFSIRDF